MALPKVKQLPKAHTGYLSLNAVELPDVGLLCIILKRAYLWLLIMYVFRSGSMATLWRTSN